MVLRSGWRAAVGPSAGELAPPKVLSAEVGSMIGLGLREHSGTKRGRGREGGASFAFRRGISRDCNRRIVVAHIPVFPPAVFVVFTAFRVLKFLCNWG